MFSTVFGKFFSKKTTLIEEVIEAPESIKSFILDALNEYRSDIFPLGIIAFSDKYDCQIKEGDVIIIITLPFPCITELQGLSNSLSETLKLNVTFDLALDIKPVRQHDIANVGNIIAIASGKGGVGKSTTSVNLAYALIAEGAKVGILDADIYGPSIPSMLGHKESTPESFDGKLMQPIQANGLYAMSIGFLVPDEEATVWRGPMASSAFNQLLNETAWPELDYLIIDMPPGTGDIQLTLAQKVPVAAAVIVTTPQDIALYDAIKGVVMFDKVKVPVLGVIENMSYHICENCGHQSQLFGEGGGEHLANEHKTKLLGQLPLNVDIRENADLGHSIIMENSTSDIAQQYRKIAISMAAELYLTLDSRSPATPEIVLS
jgi:ATP-binding protein involved in chromosome partitioning